MKFGVSGEFNLAGMDFGFWEFWVLVLGCRLFEMC